MITQQQINTNKHIKVNKTNFIINKYLDGPPYWVLTPPPKTKKKSIYFPCNLFVFPQKKSE